MGAGCFPRLLSIAKKLHTERISARMSSTADLRRQVDSIDRQIVELLSRRMTVVRQVLNQLDEDAPDKEREAQVLSNWLEEGFDYDLDEASLEKVSKAVMEMGRKAKDR